MGVPQAGGVRRGRLNSNSPRRGWMGSSSPRRSNLTASKSAMPNHLVENVGVTQGDPLRIQAADLEGEDTLQFPINEDIPISARGLQSLIKEDLPTWPRAPIDTDRPTQVMEGDPELGGSHLQQFQTVIREFPEAIVAPVTVLDNTPTR